MMEHRPSFWGSFFHPVNTGQVLAGVLGLGLCVTLGAITGHFQMGIVAAFGGLAMSTAGAGASLRAGAIDLAWALTAGTLGFLVAALLPDGPSLLVLPLVFFVAAMIGGISRRLARATTVFNLNVVIGLNLGGVTFHSLLLPVLFLAGALTTFLFAVLLWPLRRPTEDTPPVSAAVLWARWTGLLREWRGWGYAVRVAAGSACAILAALLIPIGHSLWILLTVVTVIHRNIFHVPPRMFQRGLGTLIGVLLLLGLSLAALNAVATLVLIAALTALRVHLKDLNYLVFSTVMTVLIILMLDYGQPLSYQTMLDRIEGTMIGCVLAYVFGYLLWPKATPQTVV